MSPTPPELLGYCTNVHAGADLATTRANLARHAVAVRRQFCPSGPMGIGLWLSAAAARELTGPALDEFRDWLADAQLVPYTFNGFPYGDFHRPVVKHCVYEPAWDATERRDYTLDLARIMDALLPAGREGTISTLPIAWGRPPLDDARLDRAAAHLRDVARELARLERETGRVVSVCIEPEPGCVFDRSQQIVDFFERRLFRTGDEATARRHVRVCHDVCHAAVMFEPQAGALATYDAAGVAVGKVQVSSAVCAPFHELDDAACRAALAQLSAFAEDRYLHQTVVKSAADGATTFHEDLPGLLAGVQASGKLPRDEWRIHFHVPIYLERFGELATSRGQIVECLAACDKLSTAPVAHYEVETYAWGVLPAELQQPELSAGIAAELAWLRDEFARL